MLDAADLAKLEAPKPQIEFAAYHHACDPDPNKDPYWFDIERAPTLKSWCGWVHHLCGKTWMGKQDVERMLTFWFKNRGVDMHTLAK